MSKDNQAHDPFAEQRMEFLLAMRRRGIQDLRVLRALELVPRERFVEPEQVDLAYEDHALPIECGQTISQPYVVAAMTEALALEPTHKVLEIGTGSGYQAAVLAHLAGEVVTIERYRTLAETAERRLRGLGLNNVTVIVGDGALGAPEHAPFDRIIVTAAAPDIPQTLVDQLVDNGILVVPVGPMGGVQSLLRIRKKPKGEGLERQELMAVRFVPLVPGKAAAL
ncbi:MAG TPA: protein-L-isoaspartate(D-aspartate) O-methyltransferase [Xanthobacteraceae bacterium]|jgi:protein-L-isoaspartate(D-aspartate) O-methyltransferase